MADHAREGQTVDRTRCAVVIPSPEIRVAGDGNDLLEVVHLLQSVRAEAGSDRDDVRDALGPMHSEVEGHHSAKRSPNHGVKFFDSEVGKDGQLRPDNVMHRDSRKFSAVGLLRGGIDRARTA